ncbi:Gamma-tubulin complex component 2 [Thoreauomyces humboldtii]|nr:Gamma-tubulin complex component 2 [Thoreauomyces humboldtii]
MDSHSLFKYGRVHHALAATMSELIKSYYLLVVQLEHQALSAPDFTLQKLWFYLHPSLSTMSALASVTNAISVAERLALDTEPRVAMSPENQSQPDHKSSHPPLPSKTPEFTRGGGLVLSVLSQRLLSYSGDPVLKALYAQLLSTSAVPYNAMLSTWIHAGEIFDPNDEFMVVESPGLSKEENLTGAYNDVYWAQRYTLREDYVPSFLAMFQEKILLAGKYLNVVRECGVDIPNVAVRYAEYRASVKASQQPALGDVVIAMGGERFVEDIESAYGYANRTLLTLLFEDYSLLERLRSVKHYFLLDRSDFLVHFLDVAQEHLLKPAHDVGVEQVKSLLELILRDPAASPGTNAFKEDIEAELSPDFLIPCLAELIKFPSLSSPSSPSDHTIAFERFQAESGSDDVFNPSPKAVLGGIEAFQLRYTAPFPTSLIISKDVLAKYQVVFRHLFQCKYIERQLSDAWRDQNKSKLYARGKRFRSRKTSQLFLEEEELDARAQNAQVDDVEESLFMARMCALRTKMLHFMQQYMYHVGYEVVEQLWQKLEEDLITAGTIEDVIKIHHDFQDRCIRECMLSNAEMVKVFSKLMSICTEFCHFSYSYTRFKAPFTTSEDGAGHHSYQGGNDNGVPVSLGHASHPSALPDRISDAYIASSGGAILSGDQARSKLTTLEASFLKQMRTLIDILKYYGATEAALFASLAARLDYNMFYARLPPDLSIVVRAPSGT